MNDAPKLEKSAFCVAVILATIWVVCLIKECSQ